MASGREAVALGPLLVAPPRGLGRAFKRVVQEGLSRENEDPLHSCLDRWPSRLSLPRREKGQAARCGWQEGAVVGRGQGAPCSQFRALRKQTPPGEARSSGVSVGSSRGVFTGRCSHTELPAASSLGDMPRALALPDGLHSASRSPMHAVGAAFDVTRGST